MFNLDQLIRPNIKILEPYSSARDEFTGQAKVYLDANENSFGSPLTKWYNRYPDPHQWKVKEKLSAIKGVPVPQIFLGNGSDECIDLLFRVFCEPAIDNVLICPPTYGMYEVTARINNVDVKKVNLTPNFQLDLPAIEKAIDDHTKMIFLCSPNNPTGNNLSLEAIEAILNNYFGLVVVDEAYINFSRYHSLSKLLPEYPNLVVLQTLSKAWGLAALRLGIAFSSGEICSLLSRIKPPYNISQSTQDLVLEALENVDQVNNMILEIVEQRKVLAEALNNVPRVQTVYPSDANFLLVKISDARACYEFLLKKGIVVRDRSRVILCDDCLRITVGTPLENQELIASIHAIK
ncbi:MAG TPA: histidinol-phosphate transaminase [Flavitalea sp.]|nr:histidinol-phosphate transaminase [Flavitalea sp.]